MGNAVGIWGATKTATVSIEGVLNAYLDADETGRALIEVTGVAAQTVEADYSGPSNEADAGWDF